MPGTLFIVSAPSGAGKTSLIHAVIARTHGLSYSVSHTTRPARPGENHGVDYFFVPQDRFNEMKAADEFIEHATVFGNQYGTTRQHIEEQLADDIDIVLDLDWQGARTVRQKFPDAISIFILPPSIEQLRERLCSRGQDSNEVIEHRLQLAQNDIGHYNEYDFLIVNEEFDRASGELEAIILCQRLKQPAQTARHADLISKLLE